MALQADLMFYRPNMQYRPSFTFPPNPAHLQASQAANGPHMTQSGPSAQGKSISTLEVGSCSFAFLIILLLPQSSQSLLYHGFH